MAARSEATMVAALYFVETEEDSMELQARGRRKLLREPR